MAWLLAWGRPTTTRSPTRGDYPQARPTASSPQGRQAAARPQGAAASHKGQLPPAQGQRWWRCKRVKEG
ncbi:hypothetical protein BHE74_00044221 [Ensete ventricosum]|nr:hypothetical protein BHE74_00044221 [Ensete ventricosum]